MAKRTILHGHGKAAQPRRTEHSGLNRKDYQSVYGGAERPYANGRKDGPSIERDVERFAKGKYRP